MSDSIVQILTLKFLACFLNNELNPIFAAKALAMVKSLQTYYLLIQSPTKEVHCQGIISVTLYGVDSRGCDCPALLLHLQLSINICLKQISFRFK